MSRITLDLWLLEYDERCRPTLNTARAWAKNGKLDPPAVKEGRAYYVEPGTRYNPAPKKKPTVRERLLAETQSSHAPRPAG